MDLREGFFTPINGHIIFLRPPLSVYQRKSNFLSDGFRPDRVKLHC